VLEQHLRHEGGHLDAGLGGDVREDEHLVADLRLRLQVDQLDDRGRGQVADLGIHRTQHRVGVHHQLICRQEEVEDNLAALRVLADEATEQADAVTAAERSLALAMNRYQAGITTYLEVITAQGAALANERAAVDVLTRRMTASVNLIKGLGGGWREPSPRPLPRCE
jgi:hypothetical protein